MPASLPRYAVGCALCIFVLGTSLPLKAANADERSAPTNHRLAVQIGPALSGNGADVDGHYGDKAYALGSRLQYYYRFVRGFEGGGSLSYWLNVYRGGTFHVFVPDVTLRPYLPLMPEDTCEIGLDAHLGFLAMVIPGIPGIWSGVAASAGPSVRLWIDPRFAVQAAGEITIARGNNPSDFRGTGLYVRNDGGFVALGIWLGGTVAL